MHKHRRAENVPRIKAIQENQDQTLACDVTISLGYEKMPRIWIINKHIYKYICNIYLYICENIWLSEGLFCQFSPEHIVNCLIPNIYPEFLLGVVEGQQLKWSWFNLCRGSWQGPVSDQQGPFIAIKRLLHKSDQGLGALHGHCVPWCWECSFPDLAKIPLIGHSNHQSHMEPYISSFYQWLSHTLGNGRDNSFLKQAT